MNSKFPNLLAADVWHYVRLPTAAVAAAAAAPAVCLSNEHDLNINAVWPTWLHTGSVRRTLIRDIGEECAGEGSAGAFKDLTNKTCQRELGSSQN